jgi:hypothetical protein
LQNITEASKLTKNGQSQHDFWKKEEEFMKITSFDWTIDSNDAASLRCPVCGTAWVTDDDGEYSREECGHLLFVWTEGGVEYFGDWDKDAFEESYIRAYMKIEEIDDPNDVSMDYADFEVIESLDFSEIDAVFEITETGIACGPVSFTTLFGVKF